MKPISLHLTRTFALAFFLLMTVAANAADTVLPRIAIDNAPLVDTIRTLARQSEMNIILDPTVPGSDFEPGRSKPEPNITMVWTNITARAALTALLDAHKLKMVTSPATTVTRIAPVEFDIKPVSEEAGTKLSKVIPLMALDSAPLTEAITSIARSGDISISFGPKVTELDHQGNVTVRWEKITNRQALAALLDNYSLVMTEDPTTLVMHISLKAKKE